MKNQRRTVRLIIICLLAAVCIWTVWGNITVGSTAYEIRDEDIPEAFDGYKIVQISDLHNAQFGENNTKIIEILREEQPDMIAITGDLVDSSHTDIEAAVTFVRQAVTIAPCYYVTGNHEAWLEERYNDLENRLLDCGVIVLHNEEVRIERNGETICLIGVDDPHYVGAANRISDYLNGINSSGPGDIETNDPEAEDSPMEASEDDALETVPLETADDYRILLSHRPELFDTYVEAKIDLVLSGHAHGGQFRLPLVGGLVAPDQGFFPEYDSGIYRAEDTVMAVSRGIGNSIIPVRVNNRPEIVLVILRSDRGA